MQDTKISTAAANAQADAIGALLNNGYLRIYGAQKRGDADFSASAQPLATLRFAAQAFNPSVGGVIQSLPLLPDLNTNGTGEPTWFAAVAADGVTAVFDGTIGVVDCNVNIQTNNDAPLVVHAGGEFHIGSIAYTVRRSA